MIKLLGIFDIIASILICSMPFKFQISHLIILTFAFYLLIKAVIFIRNPVSWVDLIAAGVIFLQYFSLFSMPKMVFFVLALILFQKGIFSLIGE